MQETSKGSRLFLQICVGCERVHPVGVKTRMSKSPECQTVQSYEKSVCFIHVWCFQAATSAPVLCIVLSISSSGEFSGQNSS